MLCSCFHINKGSQSLVQTIIKSIKAPTEYIVCTKAYTRHITLVVSVLNSCVVLQCVGVSKAQTTVYTSVVLVNWN